MMTTLTVHIKDLSQTEIIKKILTVFDVEVIEQTNVITNPQIIDRLERHYEHFKEPTYREENYVKVNAKTIWEDIQSR